MDNNVRHYIKRSVFAIIPVLIIISVFLYIKLLPDGSEMIPLEFQIVKSVKSNGALSLQGHFTQRLPENAAIWVYADNAEITIQSDGNVYRYNTGDAKPDVFRSPGSEWYLFSYPDISRDKEITFIISSYYGDNDDAAHSMLSRIYLGNSSGLYGLMLGQIDFFGIVLICAIIAGLLYMVEGSIDVAVGMSVDGSRIVMFGFYCFSGGLRCVTDILYPYLSLLVTPSWIASLLDAAGAFLFPIALAVMMGYYMRNRRIRTVMTVILIIQSVAFLVCLLLQILGIADLAELQYTFEMLVLILLGLILICIALELWHYRDNYLRVLFLTVLPVFLCQILEGVNALHPFMPQRFLMQYSFGISIFLLLLQLASYARAEMIKTKRMKQIEKELEESRISIMLSQIQPHFLFNSLVGIRQLCVTKPDKAVEALGHFSLFLRTNIDSISRPELIPFEKELEHVKHYLCLEKMRFGDRINIHWKLDYMDFSLPSLTIQPIVENAVRHGIIKKEEGGTVLIKSENSEDNAVITVIDNGIGFDCDSTPEDSRPHIGLDNVMQRIRSQCNGDMTIISSPDGGTCIQITLPQAKEII